MGRSNLRCFEIADLGQGHPAGGSAEHIRDRMNVLERIKQRSAPLPPEQANDWEWFRKNGIRVGWNSCPKRDAWFGDTPSKTSPSTCSPRSKTASTAPSAAGWLRSAETTCACLHCDVEQSPSEEGTCSAMLSKHLRMRGLLKSSREAVPRNADDYCLRAMRKITDNIS